MDIRLHHYRENINGREEETSEYDIGDPQNIESVYVGRLNFEEENSTGSQSSYTTQHIETAVVKYVDGTVRLFPETVGEFVPFDHHKVQENAMHATLAYYISPNELLASGEERENGESRYHPDLVDWSDIRRTDTGLIYRGVDQITRYVSPELEAVRIGRLGLSEEEIKASKNRVAIVAAAIYEQRQRLGQLAYGESEAGEVSEPEMVRLTNVSEDLVRSKISQVLDPGTKARILAPREPDLDDLETIVLTSIGNDTSRETETISDQTNPSLGEFKRMESKPISYALPGTIADVEKDLIKSIVLSDDFKQNGLGAVDNYVANNYEGKENKDIRKFLRDSIKDDIVRTMISNPYKMDGQVVDVIKDAGITNYNSREQRYSTNIELMNRLGISNAFAVLAINQYAKDHDGIISPEAIEADLRQDALTAIMNAPRIYSDYDVAHEMDCGKDRQADAMAALGLGALYQWGYANDQNAAVNAIRTLAQK